MATILFIRECIDAPAPVFQALKEEGHDIIDLAGANATAFKDLLFHCAVIDVRRDAVGVKLLKRLHALHPGAGIVVLAHPQNLDGWRVKALGSGADACESKHLPPLALLAYLGSILRRVGQSAWRLHLNTSALESPGGHIEPLSSRELAVLKFLAGSPEHIAQRAVLTEVLRAKSPSSVFDERSLDQLVCRLRRRWLARGKSKLPLKAEYGLGYRFSEEIRLFPSFTEDIAYPLNAGCADCLE